MATKPNPPILPANKRDPAGVDRLERGAMREFGRRIRKISRGYVKLLDRIPAEPMANRATTDTKARRYTFRLDQYLLASILSDGSDLVDSLLADQRDPWFFEAYVAVAYRRGTAQAFANLAQQSPAYLAGQISVADIMRSDPYRRRMALVQAREFEEMRGLAATVKSAMSRILTDGIGRGLNPRAIARNLTDQAGIEARRANKIARSEVPMALRRARWDESDEATEKYGLRTLEMHLSALSPTTRATHAARHGNLYTTAEVRDWYSRDGNAINCKCAQTAVLVDENGKPLVPQIQARALETKRVMKAKHNGPWADEDK
ncbi:phage minor head protein [uncultured Castellaniella sp.]|uniref:phage minor head protein n=1 Tax=uncultured Castellaniella sp. TaxID=647907 RepID=UPI002633A30D|nr:phage minor head protein [uncultured Castellaniella sp.]